MILMQTYSGKYSDEYATHMKCSQVFRENF